MKSVWLVAIWQMVICPQAGVLQASVEDSAQSGFVVPPASSLSCMVIEYNGGKLGWTDDDGTDSPALVPPARYSDVLQALGVPVRYSGPALECAILGSITITYKRTGEVTRIDVLFTGGDSVVAASVNGTQYIYRWNGKEPIRDSIALGALLHDLAKDAKRQNMSRDLIENQCNTRSGRFTHLGRQWIGPVFSLHRHHR